MPEITVLGCGVHYERREGVEPRGCLLFVHGAGGDLTVWADLWERIPAAYELLALDLPGHGMSEGVPCRDIGSYAEFIKHFLRSLGAARPVVFVGHSMGAAIGLTLALQGEIEGLVMIGGGARMKVAKPFLNALEARKMDLNFFRAAFSPQTDERVVKGILDKAEKVAVNTFLCDFTACDQFDVRDALDRLQVPLLLLVGEDDLLTPPKLSAEIKEKASNGEMHIIPEAGHFAMLEKPSEISLRIEEFLSQII